MNNLQLPLFYFFSAVAVAASIIVITNRRPTYSVLALALTMLALSALFVLLEAYFVAVIQVLIYAGAILVLFLFVIMLLGVEGQDQPVQREKSFLNRLQPFVQTLLAALLLAQLGVALFQAKHLTQTAILVAGNVEAIGTALFTQHLLPFELVSGVLLIGIFGVVNLAYQGLAQKQKGPVPK